jgi:hypothetical protein
VQLPDLSFIDFAGGEVEASQILVRWESGGLDLIGNGVSGGVILPKSGV